MKAVRWLLVASLLGSLGVPGRAWAQHTTTSQPSPPALPDDAELARSKTRKKAKLPAALTPALPSVVAPPDPPAVQQLLAQASALQAKYKDSEALARYQDVLKTNPQHYEALWRAAVLSVRIGNRYSDETRKAAYFNAAHQYADRALALQPEGGESNYAMALSLFSEASLTSARGRLRIFKDLRSHVYLAAERRPDLPEAWQLLGRWYYRVAHYNVLEKTFSRFFLGGYPRGASSTKAIAALEKAHELDTTRVQYCYDLARMYKYQGQRQHAIMVLQQAIKLPTYTSEDLTVNRLCQQLLEPLLRAAARRDRLHARWYEQRRRRSAAADNRAAQ